MDTIPTDHLIILGAFMIFMLLWLGVIFWVVAQMVGWPKLVEKYPAHQPRNERCWSLQSAIVGRAGYGSILRVCADGEGVHFSVIFPFSISHRPFSVPWTEITGHKRRVYFILYGVELRFRQVPSIPIKISTTLADTLAKVSNGVWKYE